MRIKKIVMGTVLAGGVGLASLGAGAGVASAAPQTAQTHSAQTHSAQTHSAQTQTTQNRQDVRTAPRVGTPVTQPGPVRRPDHRPFTYRGHRVTPTYDQHRHAWGFWFFGFWVPLAR